MFSTSIYAFLGLIISAYCAPSLDIINGDVANIIDFPYMVSFVFEWSHYYSDSSCGGSILDEKTILTAGHCAYGYEDWIPKLRIGIGHTNITETTMVKISEIYLYENFEYAPPFTNDIAIIKLSEPLTFDENVQPVKLPQPNESTPENKKGIITGWGQNQTGVSSQLLQKLEVLVWDDDACETIYKNVTDQRFPEYSYATNRTIQFCAKNPQQVTAGVCRGDSGGPLVVDGVQYGIVSRMQLPCKNSTLPIVFTKISHYLDWILPKMG